MTGELRAIAMAVLLFAVTVGIGIGHATVPARAQQSGTSLYAVDGNHDLTSEGAIREYQQSGSASTAIDGLAMAVSVHDSHESAGLDGLHVDSANTYLRVEYDEEIARTVRVFIPSAYFEPRPKDDLQPVSGSATAALEPTADASMTAVTLRLSGETTAVFAVGREAGAVFGARRYISDAMNRTIGVSVPSLGGGGPQWQPVPPRTISGANASYAIEYPPEDVTIQYAQNPNATRENRDWVTVPPCERSEGPVCWFERDGSEATYILAETTDPPPVRYIASDSPTTTGRSIVNDIVGSFEKFAEDVGLDDLNPFADDDGGAS